MQAHRSFLLQLCLNLIVLSISCTCKPLSNDVGSEEFYAQLSEDVVEEEDSDSRMANLLGTMKEGFLRQLNLLDVPREHNKISPPQFMVELYNKYASDSSAVPESDVIRSFTVQDIHSETNGSTSKHRLQFNVSIPNNEKIVSAELQLLFLRDATYEVTSRSLTATVKVYEVDENNSTSTTQLLDRQDVECSLSTWVTVDVTAVIQSWIRSGRGANAFYVTVDNNECESEGGRESATSLKMSVSIGENTSAALIFFSNDLRSRRWETKKELQEMILHEEETILRSGADWSPGDQRHNEIPEAQLPRRKKRKAGVEYCGRTSLKVNFKDIGWDSWIVAPPEYDAYECRGLCYHPLTDESTPSKHALIQTLMNIRDPGRANMACCVPIKLDPITVMYKENGRLTIRYLYEEMKVAECGCR